MISGKFQKALGQLNLDLEFEIDSHGITVISGPSGSGKSSLVKLIAGISKPDAGWLKFGEQSIFNSSLKINLPTHQRKLAIVFQEARLLPHWNVEKNLTLGKPKIESFEEIIQILGIEGLLKRKPKYLSGGEAQRVALGRALCQKPDLLMMDEPLASLDEMRKEELLPFIKDLPKKFNLPILYVTHSTRERTYLADKRLFFRGGRLISFSHPEIKSHLTLLTKVK